MSGPEPFRTVDAGLPLGIQPFKRRDPTRLPPRQWLLGSLLIRHDVTIIGGHGGVGKTALGTSVLLASITGMNLTGHHPHRRCRWLYLPLEENDDEVYRRLYAALGHHAIDDAVIEGQLYIRSDSADFIIAREVDRSVVAEPSHAALIRFVAAHDIDVVYVDPFVASYHGDENANKTIDAVTRLWKAIAQEANCAVLATHHLRKGSNTPGAADALRGGSSLIGVARCTYTVTGMSEEEAATYGIEANERRRLIRLDDAKRNMSVADAERWYRLETVRLGNSTADYPDGDAVQAVEIWAPPDMWRNLPPSLCCRILDEIDAGLPDGERYSGAPTARVRAAWPVVRKHAPTLTERQARDAIKTWLRNQVLEERDYYSEARREDIKGLFANPAKRPGRVHD